MNKDRFYLNIAHALSGCQLVEQELKLYITEALEFIRHRLDDRMPFKMCGNDYEDATLERLITTFGKLAANDALVKQLGEFKKHRNFLSHKGITACLDDDGVFDDSTVDDVQPQLDAIKIEADRLCSAIHEEMAKIKFCVASDFDDVSEH